MPVAHPTEPRSLWAATAKEPAPVVPALRGDAKADVAIIGGGFTGLSTALHLAEVGVDTLLLEAEEPGFGASGRNGGQVIPGLKYDPDELVTLFGSERGERINEISGGAADFVFGLIKHHGIACSPVRKGWIQGVHARSKLDIVKRRVEQWGRRGAPVRFLDEAEIARMTGTDRYFGGWLDERGGMIQPLSYARGLARAALAAGARIHGRSPALKLIQEQKGWRIQTPDGAVTAERVIIATNGYTDDLWPGLKRSLVPVNSFQVATQPLSDNLRATVLPGGQPLSDTRRLLLYFRLDPDGRLLMGGRGAPYGEARIDRYERLRRAAGRLFPQLNNGLDWEFFWSGKVALTADHLPHIHKPAPGLTAALGYNGRGVALASRMGKLLADHILGAPAEALGLPVTSIRPMPFWSLRQPAVSALIGWYRLRDWLD
ncbi:MAG TPA: FAD-binding oxidoreductase [Alphaproteobacteria bacterium]|nr:FAD-binding oxidoreductase [Alphaproteobacteria bacterium]